MLVQFIQLNSPVTHSQ